MAVVVLPFTVTILVPLWIGRRYPIRRLVPEGWVEAAVFALGALLLLAGLALFAVCLFWFASRGKGTLAPWDPPRNLVIAGPYRFVRNPMISGVILVLLAEACLLRSLPHAGWAAAFILINLVYLPLLEEPQLDARFGEAYRVYKSNVRRFIPRLRPWSGVDAGGD